MRKFEEIVLHYPPPEICPYPEYRGKPYYSIKYEENGEHFAGFGTYSIEVLSRYLREYFIQERPRGKWVFKHNSSNIWCSVCDEDFDEIPQKFNYCPNCGADMREEGSDAVDQ